MSDLATPSPLQKIKLLEYTILKLAEWYVKEEKPSFFKSFKFSKKKVMLLPFYISVANGPETREIMFSFFNLFKAEDEGYIEQDIKKEIDKIEFKFNNDSIVQNSNETELSLLIEKFRTENLLPLPNPTNDFKTYYDLIDHAIGVYKLNNWLLYEYEDYYLQDICKRHSGWQIYNSLKPLKDQVINPQILIAEKSVFASEKTNRMLVV